MNNFSNYISDLLKQNVPDLKFVVKKEETIIVNGESLIHFTIKLNSGTYTYCVNPNDSEAIDFIISYFKNKEYMDEL